MEARIVDAVAESFTPLRRALEEYMEAEVPRLFPGLEEEVCYALRGGKRVRGVLTLYTAERLGGGYRGALPYAYAIELMHSASLVHDDIVDGSGERRGRPSLWRRYGLGDAVTLPHLMISRAVSLITGAGVDAVRDSMDSWFRAARGQLWDTRLLEGRPVDAGYLELVSAKTGAVFEAAVFLPLYAAGRADMVPAAKRYGSLLGAVYQVVDDLASLGGEPDSGSIVALEREAGGDPEGYACRLLRSLLPRLVEAARRLDEGLLGFAVYTVRLFLEEAGARIPSEVAELVRGVLR